MLAHQLQEEISETGVLEDNSVIVLTKIREETYRIVFDDHPYYFA